MSIENLLGPLPDDASRGRLRKKVHTFNLQLRLLSLLVGVPSPAPCFYCLAAGDVAAPAASVGSVFPKILISQDLDWARAGLSCSSCFCTCAFTHNHPRTSSQTNVLAAYIAADRSADIPALMRRLGVQPGAGFEIAHNQACSLAALGEFASAEQALRLAVKQGREALFEDDFSEEEVRGQTGATHATQLANSTSDQGLCPQQYAGCHYDMHDISLCKLLITHTCT